MSHEEINNLKNTQKDPAKINNLIDKEKWDLVDNLTDSEQKDQKEWNAQKSKWTFIIPPSDPRNFYGC
jgi:hypothetical protein